MTFSEPTKATLYRLRRIAGDLLLIAPDQFALIGKDEQFALAIGKKRRQHAGLTVRGTLLNTVTKDVGLPFSYIADLIRPGAEVFLAGEKIVMPPNSFRLSNEHELAALRKALGVLDDKLSAAPVCTFGISRSESFTARKAITILLGNSPRAAVALRFSKKPDGDPKCELLLIPNVWAATPEFTDSVSWRLDRFKGEAFAVSMPAELFRQMPPSDYEVTVYSSGVAECIAMDHRLTFVIEEQEPRYKAVERRPSAASPAPSPKTQSN
jgi:hypothetical protein